MTTDVRMRGFKSRASVHEAQALIHDRVTTLGVERVSFRAALHRILAEDVVSDRNVPVHDRAAMDGYAVRAEDVSEAHLPKSLEVIAEIKAAEQFSGELGPQEAFRIMTGGKIPDGANSVVMVEHTDDHGAQVNIKKSAREGQHVLKKGEDLEHGRTVLTAGRKLRAQDVSMLVTVGALEVSVQRRPRVRIIPTGTELVRAGTSASGARSWSPTRTCWRL